MTSEREAKVWMVAAAVMLAWACIMVGCTTSTTVGSIAPVVSPSVSENGPVWTESTTLTLSPDASSITTPDQPAGSIESASLFTVETEPAAPQPVDDASPVRDIDLRGLSIAQPLVLAKRLMIASAELLPETTPDWASTISAATPADFLAQPVAASTVWAQRLGYDRPASESGSAVLGWAALERSAVMLQPWESDPTPTPNAAATLTAEDAKFDAAGMVALVIGAMVLLFGGEAVVVWALNRRGQSVRVIETPVTAEQVEDSIFRFPEPIEDDADESYSRAA
ncbi:hypothetical protein [Algisphaera agarilytica]|uniref:Uncharacterized protein n=1 Tax=Algisphaera agarilytica TaxID=1385975 RepID=A0A7X0H678_9BACT|nr:hypothetical protein [Algisphaera agarilytica]MBB6430043.1 hypothetical protein [Algisphaera agarilytica]